MIFFTSKQHFFGQKKLCTVMRTVKKTKMYLLMTRERKEISQKFQQIWIQQAKIPQKFGKNNPKRSPLIFRFWINNLKNE
jgi:hypothetical protein